MMYLSYHFVRCINLNTFVCFQTVGHGGQTEEKLVKSWTFEICKEKENGVSRGNKGMKDEGERLESLTQAYFMMNFENNLQMGQTGMSFGHFQ